MIQRQLPLWARADHPAVRSLLGTARAEPRRTRLLRAFLVALAGGFALMIGYILATDNLSVNPLEQSISQALFEILIFPVIVLQLAARLVTLGMTVGAVAEEKRRQTWDNLRATVGGVALSLRARWSTVVLYRMRGILGVLLIARAVMIIAMLYDLTAFSGEYLFYLVRDAERTTLIPDAVGVLFLSLTMTAALLLPLTGIGLDAALGLLLSTLFRQRLYIGLAQVGLSAVRVGLVIGLLILVADFRQPTGIAGATDLSLWVILLLFAAIGDWGFSFLYLGFFGAEVWANIPYGIFIGPALLLFVFMQTALTDVFLALAMRFGERRE